MSTPGSPRTTGSCQSSSTVESSSSTASNPDHGLLIPVSRASLLAPRLLRLRSCSHGGAVTRRKREMTPAHKKDASYWDKRQKNNEAAKRSRERKRLSELMMEGQLLALSEENAQLRAHVRTLQFHRSLSAEPSVLSLTGQTHSPVYQAGLRGDTRGPLEDRWTSSNFTGSAGGLNPQVNPTHRDVLPVPTHWALTPRGCFESGGSAEPQVHGQVSSSDDVQLPHPASSVRVYFPTPDTLHLMSQNWLVPHVSRPSVYNNLLGPWRSSYLAPPTVCPGMPLCIEEGPGLAPVGMKLSPVGP